MLRASSSSRGFTLVEIMIVIAMILILLGTSIFPYAYYMDRARVEKTLDTISQEWIIAHQKVRGGLIAPGTDSHAHIYIDIDQGANSLTFLTSTGGDSQKTEMKKYTFDTGIEILDLTGSLIDSTTTELIYHIAPPFATGAFSTGTLDEYPMNDFIMTVGYHSATKESKRARDILLRPYFD